MYFLFLPLSFFISLILCALSFPLSYSLGAIDMPDGVRKMGPTRPRLIGLGFILTFILFALPVTSIFIPVLWLLPSAAILLIGTVLDDTRGLSPIKKLCFQALSLSTLILLFGTPSYVSLFGIALSINPIISFILTLFLGLLLINSANIIDGLDTLLLSLSLISLISVAFLSFIEKRQDCLYLSLTLFFALLGFLPYNLPRAKGFMGDTGAQFLGLFMFFVFLYLGKDDTLPRPGAVFVGAVLKLRLELLLLFFLPPFEIALSFLRRIIKNKSPFVADRGHLHYLLKEKGLSTTEAVLVLCLFHLLFCILFFSLIGVF